jgi:predicted ATP-grasp superfamily ATP-dependent carboligase
MAARRIAVYEFLTSGGWANVYGSAPPESLAAEGRAMFAALAADFAAAGCQTLALVAGERHWLPPQPNLEVLAVERGAELDMLASAAVTADWTVVIAPEFDGLLSGRCNHVRVAGRLLGPAAEAIEMAADKVRLCEDLLAAGVPTPSGRLLAAGETLPSPGAFEYPAVCKPRWGCGSQDVALVRGDEPPEAAIWQWAEHTDRRLERFVPGQPASVAFLCGPRCVVSLPACSQRLADDGSFAYLGGETPLAPVLSDRAVHLAARAVRRLRFSLIAWLGYIGVDLVLGDDPSGRDDVVIEINPRLTTSYVGLRAAVDVNLASAMLDVAEGGYIVPPAAARHVTFTSTGVVQS